MPRADESRLGASTQVDPGESVEPRSLGSSGFDVHTWTSINQIFDRLGKMDQKIDQISSDQKDLKASVEKHDKLITRAIFTVGGALAVIACLWFVYEKFLEGHITFTP